MSGRTNLDGARTPRPSSGQRLALLLSGVGLMAGCYLTLDTDELDAKAAGEPVEADAGPGAAGSSGFTTSLDTPAIELADGTTTRDPCVATTRQAREILTTHCAECHAPPGAAAGFQSILDVPTLITLRSATARDPETNELVRLLIPGQPEKSRLYLRARNGEMPPTRPPSERQLPRPTTSDISVLRTWIQSCLPQDPLP
jgi:mono/diheme cytochrome c family protein